MPLFPPPEHRRSVVRVLAITTSNGARQFTWSRSIAILAAILTLLAGRLAWAQSPSHPICYTDSVMKHYWAENGGGSWDLPVASHEYEATRGGGEQVVSVVVHVVWNIPADNIPDGVIQSMITQLDEDFNLMNANAGTVRPAFEPVMADAGIRFCLAQIDPNGAPTTGITRTQTTATWFSPSSQPHAMKTPPLGVNAWDPDHYLNIWICDIVGTSGNIVSGYSYLPTGGMPGSWQDGLVIDCLHGTDPDERTPTHEAGHYFGLRHTFDGNNCFGGDGFSDTPSTDQPTWNCNNTNLMRCGVLTQYENYMDYSGCTAMFTTLQAGYMNNILSTTRSSLLSSAACSASSSGILASNTIAPTLFPNPATTTVRLVLGDPAPSRVHITDALGRDVRSFLISGREEELSIEELPAGPYSVRIEQGDLRTVARLIVAAR